MSSKVVFELRNAAKNLQGISKLNKLVDALTIANRLFAADPDDDWNQKALAYTLIDLCKYYILDKKINQAEEYYNQLLAIDFYEEDSIIESQKDFLRPKIDINYLEVQHAEELSKHGDHQGALTIFKKLIAENRLTEIHHEAYGWVMYRYVKDCENGLTTIQVRTYLRDYLNLQNARPSMLHSMILNFALQYSKEHAEFNLYNFFKLWKPANLRSEDKEKQIFNEREIPSLVSRLFREFIEKDLTVDINYLIENVKLDSWGNHSSSQQVLDLLREPFFWKLFNAHKENKDYDLWNLFNQYNVYFAKFEKSKWHSEVLSLAERYMQESEEWRFWDFFKNWNPENFLNDDWKEVKRDENKYKPLAIKCLKKAFEIAKTHGASIDLKWLIDAYSKAVNYFPNDEWLLRENALLLIKSNSLELASNIYKKLVLDLGDKSYIWHEFSSCFQLEDGLKIGMLSKALQLEKNEDFLGDIHLELARTLLKNNLIENCIIELQFYKRHRELKGWKLSEGYFAIFEETKDHTTVLKNNANIYNKYTPIAEKYAYENIPWTEVVLVDNWKNEDGKERLSFTNGKNIEFSISRSRFRELRQVEIGRVYKFKLHKNEVQKEVEGKFSWSGKSVVTEIKYVPLIVENSDKPNWSILEDAIAVVDYINAEKGIVHAITTENKEVFFPKIMIPLQINDLIRAKCFSKKVRDEYKVELKDIIKIDRAVGVINFQKKIAVIDSINYDKSLFHFVVNRSIHGIIKFSETDVVPEEGKFIELYFVSKKDKKLNKTVYKAIEVRETKESNLDLLKSIHGNLELKYRSGANTLDYYDLDEDDLLNMLPDFGFVGDYYVPKNVLTRNGIVSNCEVAATAIFGGDKWKVIKLTRK